MAVVHFKKDGNIVCGTKAAQYTSTENKAEVTCKRCIKKLENKTTKVKKTSKKALVGKGGIEFVEDSKHGFGLAVGRDTLLKLGKTLDSKIGVITFFNPLGIMTTSMKFASSTVEQIISVNEINFLRTLFEDIKSKKGFVTVFDVKEALVTE